MFYSPRKLNQLRVRLICSNGSRIFLLHKHLLQEQEEDLHAIRHVQPQHNHKVVLEVVESFAVGVIIIVEKQTDVILEEVRRGARVIVVLALQFLLVLLHAILTVVTQEIAKVLAELHAVSVNTIVLLLTNVMVVHQLAFQLVE